jgi:hypothetical protein
MGPKIQVWTEIRIQLHTNALQFRLIPSKSRTREAAYNHVSGLVVLSPLNRPAVLGNLFQPQFVLTKTHL